MLRALTTFGLALTVAAQGPTPCYAEFNSPVFLDNVSMGGPNLLVGIKMQVPTAVPATRIEVFTGERSGMNTIAVWSHDAAGDRPLASLGGGSWNMGITNSFQGANFTPPVLMVPATTYWIVWGPQNGAQITAENRGPTVPGRQPYRGSFDGGMNWNGPFIDYQWKFRIFCSPRPAHYEVYGTNCPGSNRTAPLLSFIGTPAISHSMQVLLTRALPNTGAVFTLGNSDTTWLGIPLPLDLTSLGATGCTLLASGETLLFSAVDAAGAATQTLAVPNDASLLGAAFFDQWWVVDPTANPAGIVLSNAGRGTIGN
jgi:hypothetical protein